MCTTGGGECTERPDHRFPTPVSTKWGFLFVDSIHPRPLGSTVAGAEIAEHAHVLPPDPHFIGLLAASRGTLRGPGGLVTLTNAEVLKIGRHGQ